MRAGGLIYHFMHDPIALEITMKREVFTFVDNSKDKLSVQHLFLVFVIWIIGMVLGFVCFVGEIFVHKNEMANKMNSRGRPKVASFY